MEAIKGGKTYRGLVLERVRQAGREILMGTHRLEFDAFGQALLSELEYACQRGLTVRLLIDGEGSAAFIREHPALLTRLETRFRIGRHGEGSTLVFDGDLVIQGLHELREDPQGDATSRLMRGDTSAAWIGSLEEKWNQALPPDRAVSGSSS